MKYDDKLHFSKACMNIFIQRNNVDLRELTRAEVVGLWLLNEISEKELKDTTNITDGELEHLTEIILELNNKK